MRTVFCLVSVAALMLGACNSKSSIEAKNESAESVAKKVDASDLKPRPGRWESAMKFEKMEIPGMPPQAQAAMQKGMATTKTFITCLTPEQVNRPNAGFFGARESGCTYQHFTMAGGTLDAEMTCNRAPMQMHMTMQGTLQPRWLCDPGQQPGRDGPGQDDEHHHVDHFAPGRRLQRDGGNQVSVTIEPIKPFIGGIVHVDKAHLCDDETVEACRAALEDRGVLVFPQAHLTNAEQLAFTDKFGQRVKFTGTVPGGENTSDEDDELYKITLDKEFNAEPEYVLGTWFWHIDGVTIDQPLPKATLLSARKLSPSGGQTEFASTLAAWDQLPEAEKAAIADLKVIHRMEASMRPMYIEMPEERLNRYRTMSSVMLHPLVWTQSSGRKSLVLGTHADEVVGMSLPEGRSLLARLTEWVRAEGIHLQPPVAGRRFRDLEQLRRDAPRGAL